MNDLTRNYNWSSTPLGTPDQWPQSLRTTLSILLNSRFPMFLFWGTDLICFYNDAYRPSLGNNGKHPWALGKPAAEVWPEIWSFIKPMIDTILEGGEASWYEDQLLPIYRNGKMEEVYWTFSYSPVNDETGKPAGVFVTCSETTQAINSLSLLKESEDQLRFAIEATELGTWDYNPTTNKFSGNSRLKEWFGIHAGQEIDLSLATNVIKEGEREKVNEAIRHSLQYTSGGSYDIEYTIVHPLTREERIVRARGRAWFNQDKIAYRFNGTLQDVTAQVLAFRKTAESQLFADDIINNSEAAQIVWLGEEMVFSRVNHKMLELLGRDSSIIGKKFIEAIPELKETPLMDRLRHVLRTGEPYHQPEELFVLHRHGIPYTGYYNYSYKALVNANKERYGIICTAIEVTDLVVARQLIEEAQHKARLAIASANLGTYEVNLLTNEITTDSRFNMIWGGGTHVDRSEFISFIHPDDLAVREAAHLESVRTGHLHYEARLIHKDQSLHWVRANGQIIYDTEGRPAALLGVVKDITESKLFTQTLNKQVQERTEELQAINEELIAINEELGEANSNLTQSNAELAQFTYAASHDMQEPLRKVQTFIDIIINKSTSSLDEHTKKYLIKINSSVNRMKLIIDDLLGYSHQTKEGQQIVTVDLNEVIRNVTTDLELIIEQKEAVITITHLPQISAIAGQMNQLFLNLINNALKFSKPDTPPRLSIVARPLLSHEISGRKKLRSNTNYIQIDFIDNGIGFESQYADQIFELFKRLHSKSDYEGTGIGLSLCKKIVDFHKGDIYASSAGSGATFHVILPGEM